MEPDEGGCYHFPEQVTEDASSTSSASAYPAYASALSSTVRLCGPDVITTAGSILTNGVDCLPGELPGATAVSFGSKTGVFSEINETQDISFASARQDSFHREVFGSDSTKGDLLPVFSPPDILSSSGRIMSADMGRSMEGSCMENSARGGEQSKQLEYALCFQGNEDLQNRFIHENAIDGMHSGAADQDANDFVVAFSQSPFFRTSDLGSNEDAETKKPSHLTMQTYEQSYSYSVTGRGFADDVETAATELKNDDRDIDKAISKVKDADSLMSVSSPVLRSIVSGMPLRETSDTMECLSFIPQSSVDAGRLINNNADFPEGSGSLCVAGVLNKGSSSSQSPASFFSNVDCLAIDGCKDKELCGYGLRNCSLSLFNGEKNEIFDKPAGQNHESLQNPVLYHSDGMNRSNRKDKESPNGTLHLSSSDVHDEESLCLLSSETPSLPAAFRLSGSCSSDNSSRSGSISSTGGKFSDTSALDNDKAMKIDAPNKCTTSVFPNKAENHSSAVNISPAASNSDSSPRGIPTTLARVQPMFLPPSSSAGPSSSSYEVPQNISLSPPLSSNINLPITQLGRVAPTWLPDSEALRCMQCDAAFSFTKRRHHCRACGKIFCGNCSNLKSALHYLENKESRVCSKCYQDLIRAQYYQKIHRKSQLRPNPNNPSEYCSVISPLLQVQSLSAAPLPSIMVPTSGVLRKQGSFKCKSEAKQVMFSDGIRPGGDLTEVDGLGSLRSTSANVVRQTKRVGKQPGPNYKTSGDLPTSEKLPIVSRQSTCLIPSFGGLPPVVVNSSSNKGYSLMDSPTMEFVLHHMRNADLPVPVTFVIDKYLAVIVKIVNLDCCVNRVCWSFTTKGMRSVGQDEIVILLECFPDEHPLPTDIFLHLHSIYLQASQGNPVNSMGHTILPPGCLGSLDHGGFLFIRHTFQCLERLILPEPPYLFGILLQKWEIAWAKVFPLRLLLRLGAEFRYYPCPLVSVRDRQPVYGEIGHTIMNLLADFHNYQYMVSHINGLVIHLEMRKTTVRIPSSRYDAVMKVLNSTNGHVLALGADFSTSADSHLVCVQNDDGSYQTQAINHQKKACKVTGASFAVFNGALKPAPGTLAKSSVVEDGVMIQVTPSTMAEIKQSWKNMKNVTIDCSHLGSDDVVTIEWVDDSTCTASNNLKSPVDGMPLDGKEMRRIHGATDYAYDDHVIRWTEIFLLCNETNESTNVNRLIDQVAQTACTALVSHSSQLTDEQMTKIGLRVTVGSAEVSFKAGSNNHSLPDSCIYELEEKLLPLLQKYLSSSPSSALLADQQGTLAIELIFNVLHLSSMIASTYAVNLPD